MPPLFYTGGSADEIKICVITEQDRQCNYHVTMRRVRATTVAVEKP